MEHFGANVDHIHHLAVVKELQLHLNFFYEQKQKIVENKNIRKLRESKSKKNYCSLMSSFFGVVGDVEDMMLDLRFLCTKS